MQSAIASGVVALIVGLMIKKQKLTDTNKWKLLSQYLI